jgi:hypothetical protein
MCVKPGWLRRRAAHGLQQQSVTKRDDGAAGSVFLPESQHRAAENDRQDDQRLGPLAQDQ